MKKVILYIALFSVVFVGLNFVASGQNKRWTMGAEAAFLTPEISDGDGQLFGTLAPRFVLTSLDDNSSLSLGTYAGINAQSQTTFVGGTSFSSSEIFIKVPLMFQYNYGRLNTPTANNRAGFFAGLGPEFTYGRVSYEGASASDSYFGFQATAGVRFKLPFHLSPGANWSSYINYSEQSLRVFMSKGFEEGTTFYGLAYGFSMFSSPELAIKRRGGGGGGGGGGYQYRRASQHRSQRWFKRANRRQRTRVPRGDRSWLRSNRLRL